MPLTVTPMAGGQTTIIKSNVVTNGAVVIHTVTTNATLYLVNATLSLLVTAASQAKNSVYLEADTGGNNIFQIIKELDGMTTAAIDTLAVAASLTPAIPMPISSGSVIRVRSAAANFAAVGSIMGWEDPDNPKGVGLVILTFNEVLRVKDKVVHTP